LAIAIYFFLTQNRQMDTTETGMLCQAIEHAAAQINESFTERTPTSEILDEFWLLIDLLSRLLEAVENEHGDVEQCRNLIRNVVPILESPRLCKISWLPAVKLASETIINYLISLEQKTQVR
jgi:hypothetical protein